MDDAVSDQGIQPEGYVGVPRHVSGPPALGPLEPISTDTINTATLPQFSELKERTTAPPQSIFNMVVRCGNSMRA